MVGMVYSGVKDTKSSLLCMVTISIPNCILSYTIVSYINNEKLSLLVAWSSLVSISCFKVRSSIGHLVCFFDKQKLSSLWSEVMVSLMWDRNTGDVGRSDSISLRKGGKLFICMRVLLTI